MCLRLDEVQALFDAVKACFNPVKPTRVMSKGRFNLSHTELHVAHIFLQQSNIRMHPLEVLEEQFICNILSHIIVLSI